MVACWDTRTVSDLIKKKVGEKKAGTEDYLSCLVEPETIPVTAFYTDDLELCGLSGKVKWFVDGFVSITVFKSNFPARAAYQVAALPKVSVTLSTCFWNVMTTFLIL